ncbi:MAG TPA: hypothetical protein VJ813_15475 [Vicinamibacterales bacterium]|nr:hypothetical protein [Vicinamibacterales bacterium]
MSELAGSRRRTYVVVATMLGTFVVFRTVLHLRPDTDLFVAGYDVHHLYTGVLLMAIFGLPAMISERRRPVSMPSASGFAIGLTLALDQWVYLITTDGTNAAYVTPWSLWSGAVMVLLGVAYALVSRRP